MSGFWRWWWSHLGSNSFGQPYPFSSDTCSTAGLFLGCLHSVSFLKGYLSFPTSPISCRRCHTWLTSVAFCALGENLHDLEVLSFFIPSTKWTMLPSSTTSSKCCPTPIYHFWRGLCVHRLENTSLGGCFDQGTPSMTFCFQVISNKLAISRAGTFERWSLARILFLLSQLKH